MPILDISADELRQLIKNKKENLEIIDVREPDEYAIIHIKGSKLIPMNELGQRLEEIDWKKDVVFICRSGSRSKMAGLLYGTDHDIKNLELGIYECFMDPKSENLEIDEVMIGLYF